MKTAPTVDAWAVVNYYRLLAWTGRNRTKRNKKKQNNVNTNTNTKQHQTTLN